MVDERRAVSWIALSEDTPDIDVSQRRGMVEMAVLQKRVW
jgi:hypothetical protein